MKTVSWGANKYGYTVQVWDGGQCVQDYSAGNNRHESSERISPDSPNAAPLTQLREWAIQTANEMAQEFDVPADQVSEDTDLVEEWIGG